MPPPRTLRRLNPRSGSRSKRAMPRRTTVGEPLANIVRNDVLELLASLLSTDTVESNDVVTRGRPAKGDVEESSVPWPMPLDCV